MRRRKVKIKRLAILLVFVVLIIGVIVGIKALKRDSLSKEENKKITNFKNMQLKDVKDYTTKNKIELVVNYEYNKAKKDTVIESNLSDNKLTIVVSRGELDKETLKEKNVNELGKVPIMMYHGIVDTTENEYTGGNVDKDGYNRTSNAFKKDLEFYYEKGYRMIRLKDYIDGIVDVPLGYSPIILTFDDGNANNFKVIGKDKDGNLKFDPNSAIGILESFKKEHPDMNVTAIFFLNSGLCNQPKYNEDIMKWLIKNGYDIGNHTTNHSDFTKISETKTIEVVGKMYQTLESIIPNDYVKILALPFGSPYKKTHANYKHILKGNYNGYEYETEAALRVGWESEVSPFDKTFDKTFLKRCRAYDNNGSDFDIEMNFKLLDKNRYISDGDKNTITIPESSKDKLATIDLEIVTY